MRSRRWSEVRAVRSDIADVVSLDVEDDQSRGGGIQSVDRAVQILELLARNGRTAVGEVAAELGVHKLTASGC